MGKALAGKRRAGLQQMDRNFIVTLARFHRRDPLVYVVQGYFQGNSIAGCRMSAVLDNEELPLQTGVREGLSIRQKYFSKGIGYEQIDREYDLWITLPADFDARRVLKVYQYQDGKRRTVFRSSVRRLLKERRMPDGYLETFREKEGRVYIGGWAVGNSPCRLQVTDSKARKLKSRVTWHYRQDIADNYPELKDEHASFGYEISFPKPETGRVLLIIAADGQKEIHRINLRRGMKGIQGSSVSMLKKGIAYLQRNGLPRTIKRVFEKISEKFTGHPESYKNWRKHVQPTREELEAQEKNEFLLEPLISVVVPLYKTPEYYLRELVDSILGQTYRNWELCLSDGSGPNSPLKQILTRLQREDERIHVIDEGRRMGISENTNTALSLSKGEYIAFTNHDDMLPPNALYEFVRLINEHPDAELIYSDEDKVSMDGKTYFQPHFKTDFNIDLLCSMNYICHLTMVRRFLYERVGGLRDQFDGAQDYDFILRCCEEAFLTADTSGRMGGEPAEEAFERSIFHIPKVLYHWRSHSDSTSENPESKRYAFEAGMRAVQAHYDRIGVKAEVTMGEYPGLYKTIYRMPETPPLVSIIIPNKDHVPDLDQCVRSIMQRATYPAYEFIIVENNSTEEGTFEYYREMEQKHDNFHVQYWNDEFNYSLINNFGVEAASGSYLLFLNNDTQIINEDCIEQLLGPCLREEVGIVGARLFYEDNTIQHAGVIIGYGGIAGHAFQGFPATANGYFSRIICQSDLSAVTAACMMVKRSVFEQLGGFDGTLKVAFNDIDFCLRVRKQGMLVVYNPYAMLYHFESKSRGMEDTPEKIARFNQEADELMRRWPDILKNGDPYYNPNLSLNRVDFGLREYA